MQILFNQSTSSSSYVTRSIKRDYVSQRSLFTVSPNHQPSQVTNRYRLATLICTFNSRLLIPSMQGQATERILLTTTALEHVNSTRGTIDLEVGLGQAECKGLTTGFQRIGGILRSLRFKILADGSSPLLRLRTRWVSMQRSQDIGF